MLLCPLDLFATCDIDVAGIRACDLVNPDSEVKSVFQDNNGVVKDRSLVCLKRVLKINPAATTIGPPQSSRKCFI